MVATVSISIVGRSYELNCDPEQEDYLRSLVKEVDRRASELLKLVGQVGDARLLVMVALSLADEMADLKRGPGHHAVAPPSSEEDADGLLASGIEALARRVEAIADHLEKA